MNVASMESVKVCSVAVLLSILASIPRKAGCVVALLFILALIPRTDCHVFSHDDARSINGPAAKSFVDSLFEEYGSNKSMSLKEFSSLMKELKIGFITSEAQTKAGSVKENGVKNGHSGVRLLNFRSNLFELHALVFVSQTK